MEGGQPGGGEAIEVRELRDLDELVAAADLIDHIWRRDDRLLGVDVLRVLADHGGYVAGAFAGGRMVGASAAFLGRVDGRLELHSHVTGVLEAFRAAGLGARLKEHQRAWCGERGIARITWTFDPLIRANARFNLVRLGARAEGYAADYYGAMRDGVNAGDRSDRILAAWDVERPAPGPVEEAGAEVVLDVGTGGEPLSRPLRGDRLAIAVPGDIIAVRRADPELALRWRLALRQAMLGALGGGHRVVGFSRYDRYVLARETTA